MKLFSWILTGLIMLCCAWDTCFGATAGELRYYSTRHSIGIEWDISNDQNHNAVCQIQYRKAGTTSWQTALPLYRVDFNGSNMLAGSIFYLTPGQSYEIHLQLNDGGNTSRDFTLSTLPLPTLPLPGRTLYVIPGTGGGTVTKENPYRRITEAQTHVAPDLGAYEFGEDLPHFGPRIALPPSPPPPGKGSILPSLAPLLFEE